MAEDGSTCVLAVDGSLGNRLQERREDGDLRVWTYDPTSQLISEQRLEGAGWSTLTADQWGGMSVPDWGMLPALSGTGPITTFVYDPVGNRLVLNADGERTTSTYDAANRLLTSEELSGITTYTFDANGNQRTVETPENEITTYSWSYENQLIHLEEPDDVVTTYVYAPTNRKGDELRISTETDEGTIQFLYDDQNLIQEVDETNTIEAEYTLNPQPYGDLISQRRDEESTFYHFDALGSTQSLTDDTGTVENEYTYGAFGNLTSQSGTANNPFTWVGELGYYQDADGRYSLRQREYEDAIARFLSEDPLRFGAGDENLYRYVGNNPPNLTDPSGLAPEEATCGVCSASDDTHTIDADVYEEVSLREVISKILGPEHGPKFLEYQGVAAAQRVVDLYAGGWKFKIGGTGTHPVGYQINAPGHVITVYDRLFVPGCEASGYYPVTGPSLYANLKDAIYDDGVAVHYYGEPQENAYFAGVAAFCGHPNVRIVTGTAEIVGSIVVVVGSGGTATPIVLLAAAYGGIRGADSLAGGTIEAITGQPIRDLSSQALDAATGNQDLTNVIILSLDIGILFVGGKFYKRTGKTKVHANRNPAKQKQPPQKLDNKSSIVDQLEGTTEQANRIARAIKNGRIGVNILEDNMFSKAYKFYGGKDPDDVVAFAVGRQIYLRKGSASICSDTIHEGTHALDFLNGLPDITQDDILKLEKRAFFFERQYQITTEQRVDFDSISAMLSFIANNYP